MKRFLLVLTAIASASQLLAKNPAHAQHQERVKQVRSTLNPMGKIIPEPPKKSKKAGKPMAEKPQANAEINLKIEKLFDRCLDEKDQISWKEFAAEAHTLFLQQPGCEKVAETFKSLTTSTSSTYIGWCLRPHGTKLPKATQDKFASFSTSKLLDILGKRIKLNKKS